VTVVWYNAMMMDGYLKLLRNLKTMVTYEKNYASIGQRYGNVKNIKDTAYISRIKSNFICLHNRVGGDAEQ
jgi:hypothetical protein